MEINEMNVQYFDPDIAAANGFEIRSTADAREYSVPRGTPTTYTPMEDDLGPAPDEGAIGALYTAKGGNCGYSYIDVQSDTFYKTGYVIKYSTHYRKWGVGVDSDSFWEDDNLDGGATGAAWSVGGSMSGLHFGPGKVKVNPGSGALMTNGGWCSSGLPQEDHYIQ